MEDAGPQSDGMQTADLMDYMDGDDLGDSDTSNDGLQGDAGDSGDQPDTPDGEQAQEHPRGDERQQDDEFDEELADEPVAGTPDTASPDPNAAPSWEPTTPFTYSLGHQTHALGGAVRGADGVVYIPPESVEEVQRLVSRGRWHEENYVRERQQWERRLKDAETRYDENAVKAKASAEFFDKLSQQTPEQIVEFLSNWRINRPQVLAAQERAQAQELLRRAQEAQQGDPAENAYRQQETKQTAMQQVVTSYAQQPEYQFMTNEDWNGFYKRLQRNQTQMFTVADRDYGPHETTNGIAVQKGQLALNTAWLNEELTEYATMVHQGRQQAEQQREARAFNRQQKGNGRKPPPQTGARTQTGAPRDAQTGRFKSGKEWRDHIMNQMQMVNSTPE